jgi:hypothetical protein
MYVKVIYQKSTSYEETKLIIVKREREREREEMLYLMNK